MNVFELLFLACVFVVLNISCNNAQERTALEGLGSVRLSPDDSAVVFSFHRRDHGEIYKGSIDGSSIRNLLPSPKDTSYVNPVFSSDGEKILFLAFPSDKKTSNIFIVEKNGSNKRQITFQDKIITEAVFAENGSAVYYCKAHANRNYSPIGRPAPHDFDIYCIDLSDLKERRITSLNAYNIVGISEIANGTYILARIDDEKGMGMYVVSVDNPAEVKKIVPANDPRGRADLFADPDYSANFNKLAFTAPYELYLMDMENRKAELVYRPSGNDIGHLTNVLIFNHQKKILFRKDGDIDAFRIINFDGSGLRKVLIRIN